MLFNENIYIHLPWQFKESNVLRCNINNEESSLDYIRNWVVSHNLSKTQSTHWWYETLPENIKQHFKKIVYSKDILSMFYEKYHSNKVELMVINEMNEIYVSPPTTVKNTSDEVFFIKHIDGPYYYIPFATVYRVIIGMDKNQEIKTVFEQIPTDIVLQKGDVVGFDFHRESHNIQKTNKINSDFRVVLKLHYCLYPTKLKRVANLLSYLSIKYDRNFRKIFLYTISPTYFLQRVAAKNVIFWTKAYRAIEIYFGYSNIIFLLFALYTSVFFQNFQFFIYMTSYIHYIRYISTYYYRFNIAYFPFVRDYILYKLISDINMLFLHDSVIDSFIYFMLINGMNITYLFYPNGIYKYCLGGCVGYIEESALDVAKRYNTYIYNVFIIWILNQYNNNIMKIHIFFNILTLGCYM